MTPVPSAIAAFPGLCLRQARERLGLTYRDVEQASYALADRLGRPEFIIRISRLADFENGGVTPTLHKLYSLCAIYHLNPVEVCHWFDVPLDDVFRDGLNCAAPKTHVVDPPRILRLPLRFDPGFDPRRTAYLTRMVEDWKQFEGVFLNENSPYRYGYVGLEDHWMDPLLRPGSLLLVDPALNRVQHAAWKNEFERPMYFVDIREAYRCCWCALEKSRLIMQPHPLSSCAPESRRYPDDAEVIGQVVGLAMRLA